MCFATCDIGTPKEENDSFTTVQWEMAAYLNVHQAVDINMCSGAARLVKHPSAFLYMYVSTHKIARTIKSVNKNWTRCIHI